MKKNNIIVIGIFFLSMSLIIYMGCTTKKEYKVPKLPSCDMQEIKWGSSITYGRYEPAEEDPILLQSGVLIGYAINFDDVFNYEMNVPNITYFLDENNTIYNPCTDNCVPVYRIASGIDVIYLSFACDSRRIYFKDTNTAQPN